MPDTKQRYSKQRETIYQVLKEDTSHPNVDTIYMKVREMIPDISLGTVYRNLNLLADQKRILKLDFDDGVIHFDGTIEPHLHFVCDRCGAVEDVLLNENLISSLIDDAAKQSLSTIVSADILFHGICHKCSKKNS